MNHYWLAVARGMTCMVGARMMKAGGSVCRSRVERPRSTTLTRRCDMPDKKTIARAKKDKREGKSASTQAGEHVREGKHGARSTEQAIAIGLSEARRAGVNVPKKGKAAKKSKSGRKTASKKSAAKK